MAMQSRMDMVRSLQERTGWSRAKVWNYVQMLADGTINRQQLRAIAEDESRIRKRNRRRIELMASGLGLPGDFLDLFVDRYIEYGDVELALTEVRDSKLYNDYFPGNRREDGTLRYSEREYQMVTESFAATLEDFGVNPDPFASKFADLVEGDVSPDEFARRTEALYERVVRAPQEVRQDFASAAGLTSASNEAILATALDPDVRQAVMERRIDVSTLVGHGSRFGFNRSRARANQLLKLGFDPREASTFYGGASAALTRLGASASVTGENVGIGDVEDAAIGADPYARQFLTRLSAQESARYSQSAGARRGSTGELIGLDT